MIVIGRNGQTTVLTGWRAWLVAAALFVGLTFLMALIAFVVLGVAVTVGAVLLIVLPVAIGERHKLDGAGSRPCAGTACTTPGAAARRWTHQAPTG